MASSIIRFRIPTPFPTRWRTYHNQSLTAQAASVYVPFEVETPMGVVQGAAGDYLVYESTGEFHPCRRDVFEATYELDTEDRRTLWV